MIVFIIGLLLLALAWIALILDKAFFYVPHRELARRAERGDGLSSALATVTRYGADLQIFLLIIAVLAAAGGMVLFARVAPALLGVVVVAGVLTLAFFWQPRSRLAAWEARLAVASVPVLHAVFGWLQPALHAFVRIFARWYKPRKHTGIFETDDLDDFLKRQSAQRDSRINPADLVRLQRLLRASGGTVRDVMVSRDQVRSVQAQETLHPVLIDELHASGQQYFPVYEDDPLVPVGMLALSRVADARSHGRVADNMDPQLAYVQADDGLAYALAVWQASVQPLMIVIDNTETYVGVVTITALVQHFLVLPKITDSYDDRAAVAKRPARK